MKTSENISFTRLLIFAFLGILSILFTSCVELRFESKQPAGSVSLKEFPSDMIGTYVDTDCDTLIITECCMTFINNNLLSPVDDGKLKKDVLELTRLDKDYFLNFKADDHWQVVYIKTGDNSFEAYFLDMDELMEEYENIADKDEREKKVVARINKITKVRKYAGDDVEYYLVNPTVDQLKKLISSGLFIKVEEYKKI